MTNKHLNFTAIRTKKIIKFAFFRLTKLKSEKYIVLLISVNDMDMVSKT